RGDHSNLHSLPTRRSSDLWTWCGRGKGREELERTTSGRQTSPVRSDVEGNGTPGWKTRRSRSAGSRSTRRRTSLETRAFRWESVDRKSTRLNSSHVKISYA